MSKSHPENAHELLDLRWTFVPMTVVLAAVAAVAMVLIWPVGESARTGTAPAFAPMHAVARVTGASAPLASPQQERSAAPGAPPVIDTQQEDHAPTF
jgi:hypothetical protein